LDDRQLANEMRNLQAQENGVQLTFNNLELVENSH